MKHKSLKDRKAFSLIELLVVVAIIGVLATIVFLTLNGSQKKSRDAKRMSDLSDVAHAIQLYNEKYDSFPDNVSSSACTFPDISKCLEGGATSTSYAGTTKGLVLEGLVLKLPKDPRSPNLAYSYFGYPISGAPSDYINPNGYAILHANLEDYSGPGVPGSWRFPSTSDASWCLEGTSSEYCIRIIP